MICIRLETLCRPYVAIVKAEISIYRRMKHLTGFIDVGGRATSLNPCSPHSAIHNAMFSVH